MTNDSLAVLEERLAWLQRHVAEQDRAMLKLYEELDRLKQQVADLRKKGADRADESTETDERPPHY